MAWRAAQPRLSRRVTRIQVLPVQALEHGAFNDAAGSQPEFCDSLAGPDPWWLPAFLRWRQVVAHALPGILRGLAWLGGPDLPPRVGGVVALGDGDEPGQRCPPPGS